MTTLTPDELQQLSMDIDEARKLTRASNGGWEDFADNLCSALEYRASLHGAEAQQSSKKVHRSAALTEVRKEALADPYLLKRVAAKAKEPK